MKTTPSISALLFVIGGMWLYPNALQSARAGEAPTLAALTPDRGAAFAIAAPGQPVATIHIHAQADPAFLATAADLQALLSQMIRQPVAIERPSGQAAGDASPVIVLGTPDHIETLAGVNISPMFTPHDPLRREDYLLRSEAGRLLVVGATPLAVSHAASDLLYRLGYRHYMPHEAWEIVPHQPHLSINVNTFEQPAFNQRRLWNGGGYRPFDKAAHDRWYRHNRVGSGMRVGFSHIYDRIVLQNRAIFEAYLEYLALRNGQREPARNTGNKFCLSNPDLRSLVANWAAQYIQQYPQVDGVSMEPSDGMGWCECSPCAEMGSISDRVATLANQVANHLNPSDGQPSDKPPKYVGVLAYGGHSPPPNIDLHPQVAITIARGFLRGGWRFEELVDLWSQRDTVLGVYDYFGVTQWSWCLPGRGRSTRTRYMTEQLPWMHASGVRLFIAETEGNWQAAGFNYFLATRVLWDLNEASRADVLFEQFLHDCYGPAPQTIDAMRQWHHLINGDNRPLLSDDLIGRMYRLAHTAWHASDDPAVLRRLEDVILYTRYVEMYDDYYARRDETRQAAFEALIEFVGRLRPRMVVHAWELHRNLPSVDRRITMPEEARYRVPPDRNPWLSDKPIDRSEIVTFLQHGVANTAIQTFEPVTFSLDLVPATPLNLPDMPLGTFGPGTQGLQELHVWSAKSNDTLAIQATGGLIRHYRDRGDARVELYPGPGNGEVGGQPGQKPLQERRTAPDGVTRELTFTLPNPGLHHIEVTDGGDRTRLDWPEGTPITFTSDNASFTRYHGPWTLYFYVPKGTTRVAGYADHPRGRILAPAGRVAFEASETTAAGYFDIPVLAGEDGQLWTFDRCQGRRILYTVPPSLARSPREMLLPREVVERDMPR